MIHKESKLFAEKTKQSDRIVFGKFFYPLRSSEKYFDDVMETLKESRFPECYIQKRYNGEYLQVHKSRDKIAIFNSSGVDISTTLPKISKEFNDIDIKEAIFEANIELWLEGKCQDNATTKKWFKDDFEESNLVAHVFDILWVPEKEDIHNLPYKERYKLLYDLNIQQSEMAMPDFDKGHLNFAPTSFIIDERDMNKSLDFFLESEPKSGIVIKLATMKYHFNGISNEMFDIRSKESFEEFNFVLQHHFWKNSVNHYDLLIDSKESELTHYILESNPIEESEITCTEKTLQDKSWMERGRVVESIQPKTPGNNTDNIQAWIGIIDSGKVRISESKGVEFFGKDLTGTWKLSKDNANATLITLKKEELQ